MNIYESGDQKVIPAVLVYAKCGSEYLMLHRRARLGDIHAGKYNGFGGKAEFGESPLETAKRELKEESGLDLPFEKFKPLGMVSFPNFKPQKKEDWLVNVFSVSLPPEFRLREYKPVDEGEAVWVDENKLLELNLWESDQVFLPYVMREKPFMATFWYEKGKLKRQWIAGI
jgi:8-oxo-dGTP diphosphatase